MRGHTKVGSETLALKWRRNWVTVGCFSTTGPPYSSGHKGTEHLCPLSTTTAEQPATWGFQTDYVLSMTQICSIWKTQAATIRGIHSLSLSLGCLIWHKDYGYLLTCMTFADSRALVIFRSSYLLCLRHLQGREKHGAAKMLQFQNGINCLYQHSEEARGYSREQRYKANSVLTNIWMLLQ